MSAEGRLIWPGWISRPARAVAGFVRAPGPSLPWLILLAVLQLPGAAFVVKANAPGRANVDITHQARQALGEIPFDDWHPPVMSALWKLIYDTTGSLEGLLLLQVFLLFAGGWLLSCYVVDRTGSRAWSLAGVVFPLLPHVLSQAGTLWKDTQMAVALLCGVILLFWVRWRRPWTFLLLAPSLLFLIYAAAVRKNALFAVLPVVFYLAWQLAQLWQARRERHRRRSGAGNAAGAGAPRVPLWRYATAVAGTGLAFLAGVQLTGSAVDRAYDVQPTDQLSQVLLDDVMFSVPPSELNASSAPQELKDKINEARPGCRERNQIWNAYWACYGRGADGRPFSPIDYQQELRALWLETVITSPGRYLSYRAATFAEYLADSSVEYWELSWGSADAEPVGLGAQDRLADRTQRFYVVGIGVEGLPWLFKPWFWLAGAVALLIAAARPRLMPAFRAEVALLTSSAAVYMVGYFPIIPATHFRYTYWPAIAVTVAVILFAAGRWSARRRGAPSPDVLPAEGSYRER
ncbi:hypothetical protein [Sediminivirga luteola]|uniref:Uncharacterized protein n=1 Tax=Sediminivirga luteola TaxID=1774748 RepID=A0A8J2TXM4_9MICO|nr:hypothetical protein [Sediminivirga luteola]GGA13242.1 hypothetical protein GCM10011333_15210 [Sediminivirga luteola]